MPSTTKKEFKLAPPLGIMCRLEAMEECIARKSHELRARRPSATLTTGESPSPLQKLVPVTQAGEAPLPVSSDNGVPEARCIAELVTSSPAKDSESWVFPELNAVSDSDVEVGAVPGRRAAGSTAPRPLAPDRIGPTGGGGKVHYIGIAPNKRHYCYAVDIVCARADSD